jgi:hypothetical protein
MFTTEENLAMFNQEEVNIPVMIEWTIFVIEKI